MILYSLQIAVGFILFVLILALLSKSNGENDPPEKIDEDELEKVCVEYGIEK